MLKKEYVSLDQISSVTKLHPPPLAQEQPCVNDQHVVAANDPSTPTGKFPSSDAYPGPYDFEVLLDGSVSSKKSWVYSHILGKVFLDMDKVLAVQFKINSLVSGLRIRALAVYNTEDERELAVIRCTVHSVQFDPQFLAHKEPNTCYCSNYRWVGHVIQTTHQDARYEFDSSSGRHSVTVPLDPVQPGCDTVTVPYHFTCKTSCISGMNRNPIDLIFTLETAVGEVIGRQSIGVKICSCPKRDKAREECAEKEEKEENSRLGIQKQPSHGKYKRKSSVKPEMETKKIKIENISPQPCEDNQIGSRDQIYKFIEDFRQLSNTVNELAMKVNELAMKVKKQEEKIPAILKILERPS